MMRILAMVLDAWVVIDEAVTDDRRKFRHNRWDV